MNLDKIILALSHVPGVLAIALGGSQSRSEADPLSDYDLGLYFNQGELDIPALAECLKSLDDEHRDGLLNAPGEWGPWIIGGGWLTVDGTSVDLLLREVHHVEAVLKDCISGNITIDYQCGHPFGFVNTIYAAETHYCKPLWQNSPAVLDELKALLYSKGEYSPPMREAVVKRFLWEAWFSLICSRKAADRGEINYAMGSVFRTVCSWVEVLYALNGAYLMNEKGALPRISGMSYKIVDMEIRVKKVYQLLAEENTEKAYILLNELHNEITRLSGEQGFSDIR